MCDFLGRLVNLRTKYSSSYYDAVVRGIESLTKNDYEADTPEYKKILDDVNTYIEKRDGYKITTNGSLRLDLIKEIKVALNDRIRSTAKLHADEHRRIDGVKVTEQALEGTLSAYMSQDFHENFIKLRLSTRAKGDASDFKKVMESINFLMDADYDCNDFTMGACECRRIAYEDCCKYVEKHQRDKSWRGKERLEAITKLRDELKAMIPELNLSEVDNARWADRQTKFEQMGQLYGNKGGYKVDDALVQNPGHKKMVTNIRAFWNNVSCCKNSIDYFKRQEGIAPEKNEDEVFWGSFARVKHFMIHGFVCDDNGEPMTELDKKYRDADYKILKTLYDEQNAINNIDRAERMKGAKKYTKRYAYMSRLTKYFNSYSKAMASGKMSFDDLVDGLHNRIMYTVQFFDIAAQIDNIRHDDPYFFTDGMTAENKKWAALFDYKDSCSVIPFLKDYGDDEEGHNYSVEFSVAMSAIASVITPIVKSYCGVNSLFEIVEEYGNESHKEAAKRQLLYLNCSKAYFDKKAGFIANGYRGEVPTLIIYQEIFKKLKKGAGSGFAGIITAIEEYESVLNEMTPEKVMAAKALTTNIVTRANEYITRYENNIGQNERVELMRTLCNCIASYAKM